MILLSLFQINLYFTQYKLSMSMRTNTFIIVESHKKISTTNKAVEILSVN